MNENISTPLSNQQANIFTTGSFAFTIKLLSITIVVIIINSHITFEPNFSHLPSKLKTELA